MPTSNPQLTERLAWEGVVAAPTAVWIGIALAAAAGWLLWREREVIGRGWAALFWGLRLAAFACALWMLAGPTRLLVERRTETASIALFADGSQSMDVVDPTDPPTAIRWALAMDKGGTESPVTRADRLIVTLGAAQSECERLQQMVAEHRPATRLAEQLKQLQTITERAADHAELLFGGLADDDSLAARAAQLLESFDGAVGAPLAAIEKGIDQSSRAAAPDFSLHFDQLRDGFLATRRRAEVLVADVAERQANRLAQRATDVDGQSRREKVVGALDALEQALNDELASEVQVRRFRFERVVSRVDVENGWARALESARSSDSDLVLRDGRASTGLATTRVSYRPDDVADTAMDDMPSDRATNLSAVLEQLAGNQNSAGVRLAIIFTDGRHNDPDALAPQEIASRLPDLPVYLVPVGNAVPKRDVALHRVEAPSAVPEKDSAIIDLIISATDVDGQITDIVLRHEGEEVERKTIEFIAGRIDYRTRFVVSTDTIGWQEYLVEIEPLEDETNTANNYQPVSFEVVRDQTRVLLADGVPRWEYQYLNQLFRRDEHVEFDELLFFPRLQGTGFVAQNRGLPDTVDDWARYDVVILGDLGVGQISSSSQQALAQYVRERGGNLIVVAGKSSMPGSFVNQPLMELLPVEHSSSVFSGQPHLVDVATDGRFHSALLIEETLENSIAAWRSVYERHPVYELSEYSKPKPTAHTLLTAMLQSEAIPNLNRGSGLTDATVEHAFLSWHYVGAGRVGYLAAPDSYRLRWRRGDERHHRFWGQMLRWITASSRGAGEDLVRLQTDRTRYQEGEPIGVTAWLKDPTGRPLGGETLRAEARAFNDEVISTNLAPDAELPGRYFGTLEGLSAGAYQIGVAGPILDDLLSADAMEPIVSTVTVHVPDSIELRNTQANRALLEQLATVTGGQVVPPTAVGEILQLVSSTPEISERIERTPLWNRWSSLLIVLGCVFLEWAVRKKKGLV